MDLEGTAAGASRFAAYVGELTSVIGHADRARPLRDYCAGLVVTEGRRNVEQIAAVTAPDGWVSVKRLLHLVAEAPWSDESVLAKVREPSFAPGSVPWNSNTQQRSCRRSKCVKCPIVVRCRRVLAPSNWHSVCRNMLGVRSPGVRERTISCARALPAFGYAPRRSEAPQNKAKKHC